MPRQHTNCPTRASTPGRLAVAPNPPGTEFSVAQEARARKDDADAIRAVRPQLSAHHHPARRHAGGLEIIPPGREADDREQSGPATYFPGEMKVEATRTEVLEQEIKRKLFPVLVNATDMCGERDTDPRLTSAFGSVAAIHCFLLGTGRGGFP
jgi:hypothetical protein